MSEQVRNVTDAEIDAFTEKLNKAMKDAEYVIFDHEHYQCHNCWDLHPAGGSECMHHSWASFGKKHAESDIDLLRL